MATTTAIGSNRNNAGVQKYIDALFLRDNIKLYFGNSGDESIFYDSVSDVMAFSSLNVIDSGLITLGTNKDVSLSYDATSDALVFLGFPRADPGINGGLFVLSDAGLGFNVLCVSSG